MKATQIWVEKGLLLPADAAAVPLTPLEERKKFESGQVRITTSDIGTEVKWHVQSPCIASLFVVVEWLRQARGPYVLRFFASGWFEEFYPTPAETTKRIEALIARGDRYFPTRTFVREVEPEATVLKPLMGSIAKDLNNVDELAVQCDYNRGTDNFEVTHVGSKSLIARVYGDYEMSHPRQPTGSYSEAVNEGYKHVLQTGRPRADHVLAALRFPNNNVYWVPYHRIILPVTGNQQAEAVKVISQFAPINFKII